MFERSHWVVNTLYSGYQYAKEILQKEQAVIQQEEQLAHEKLTAAEVRLAEGIKGAVRGVAASAVFFYGASWTATGFVLLGLTPKNMINKLGTRVFGSWLPEVMDVEHIASNTLSLMNYFIPTSLVQLACKKGVDAAINFADNGELSRVYHDYHLGERVWLWSGVAGTLSNNRNVIYSEFVQQDVLEYQSEETKGKIEDTYYCRSGLGLFNTCELKESKRTEWNANTNTTKIGVLKGRDRQSLEAISYTEISPAKTYRANYEAGKIKDEITIPHLSGSISTLIFNKALGVVDTLHPAVLLYMMHGLIPGQPAVSIGIAAMSFWRTGVAAESNRMEKHRKEFIEFIDELTKAYLVASQKIMSGATESLVRSVLSGVNLQNALNNYRLSVLTFNEYLNLDLEKQSESIWRLKIAAEKINEAITSIITNPDLLTNCGPVPEDDHPGRVMLYDDPTHESTKKYIDYYQSQIKKFDTILDLGSDLVKIKFLIYFQLAIQNVNKGEFKNLRTLINQFKQFVEKYSKEFMPAVKVECYRDITQSGFYPTEHEYKESMALLRIKRIHDECSGNDMFDKIIKYIDTIPELDKYKSLQEIKSFASKPSTRSIRPGFSITEAGVLSALLRKKFEEICDNKVQPYLREEHLYHAGHTGLIDNGLNDIDQAESIFDGIYKSYKNKGIEPSGYQMSYFMKMLQDKKSSDKLTEIIEKQCTSKKMGL